MSAPRCAATIEAFQPERTAFAPESVIWLSQITPADTRHSPCRPRTEFSGRTTGSGIARICRAIAVAGQAALKRRRPAQRQDPRGVRRSSLFSLRPYFRLDAKRPSLLPSPRPTTLGTLACDLRSHRTRQRRYAWSSTVRRLFPVIIELLLGDLYVGLQDLDVLSFNTHRGVLPNCYHFCVQRRPKRDTKARF